MGYKSKGPATEVAATPTKSAYADSLSTFHSSLAAEGRLCKGSLRLAKYAVSNRRAHYRDKLIF